MCLWSGLNSYHYSFWQTNHPTIVSPLQTVVISWDAGYLDFEFMLFLKHEKEEG